MTKTAEAPTVPDTDNATLYVVLRPFLGMGTMRARGEVVDGSTWRMAANLVKGRYMRALTRNDPDPVSVDETGRMFIDEAAASAGASSASTDMTNEDMVLADSNGYQAPVLRHDMSPSDALAAAKAVTNLLTSTMTGAE